MRRRVYIWLSLVLSSAILFPATTAAETIRISGFIDFNGRYNIVGDRRGFHLFGDVYEGFGPHLFTVCDGDVCNPGANAVVRHAQGGLDFEGPQAFLDGVFYEEVNSLSNPAFAELGFETSPVRLGRIGEQVITETPFTIQGSFSVQSDTVTTLDTLVGSGMAITDWRRDEPDENGNPRWMLSSLYLNLFATPASPVPEPTTMILAGVAGAAAAFARRRRRH